MQHIAGHEGQVTAGPTIRPSSRQSILCFCGALCQTIFQLNKYKAWSSWATGQLQNCLVGNVTFVRA